MTNPAHAHITVEQSREDKSVMTGQCYHRMLIRVQYGFLPLLPLQAHRFDNSGEWAAIFSCNLGDVLGLCSRIRLL